MSNVEMKHVTNPNGQRNYIGNFSDNEFMIEKCFGHMNNLKRSMTLMNQSNSEEVRAMHELAVYKERDNLELALRTIKQNIRREKYSNNE